MRIDFQASDGSFEADEDALICTLASTNADGVEHYLGFQRSLEDDNRGVHLEFDDQINGDYGRLRECRLSRGLLSVDLSEQLGELVGVEGIDVALAIDDDLFEQIREGLHLMFRATPGVLTTA